MTLSSLTDEDLDPPADRRAVLDAAFTRNSDAGRAPYDGVTIANRSELEWVMAERQWISDGAKDNRRIFADLQGAILRDVDLHGLDLRGARLSHANLERANLSGCRLAAADLSGAKLSGANLSGARLNAADLHDASLQSVNLRGANLSEADLRGANLQGARMDGDTNLDNVALDSRAKLGDVLWNGVRLTKINWSSVPRLGEEAEAGTGASQDECVAEYREAARAYHGLGLTLRTQGLIEAASAYRLCEQRMERAALRVQHKYGRWLFSWFLNLLAGYGERPLRALGAYVVVVFAFGLAFFLVTHAADSRAHELPPQDALVLSISSFHGRGFLPSQVYSLDDPVAYVAAAEAVIGLFMEVVVIATFSRRFLGD